jgi:hypothetical protein
MLEILSPKRQMSFLHSFSVTFRTLVSGREDKAAGNYGNELVAQTNEMACCIICCTRVVGHHSFTLESLCWNPINQTQWAALSDTSIHRREWLCAS